MFGLVLGACAAASQAQAPVFSGAAKAPLEVLRSAAPAELQRAAERLPLSALLAVAPGDRLVTGAHGRASLRFASSAAMTLGENAELQVHSYDPPQAGQSAVLRVKLTRGALRLESRVKSGQPQDVRLNVADLRLRVFGAAVWTEASDTARTVCLFGGAVEMVGPEGAVRLDTPGECLSYGSSGRRLVLTPDEATLARKLAQTAYADEVSPHLRREAGAVTRPAPPAAATAATAARPAATAGWTLVVASLADAESAQLEAEELVSRGLPALVRVFDTASGARLYRVAIGSFPTREAAAAFSQQIQRSHGELETWIASY